MEEKPRRAGMMAGEERRHRDLGEKRKGKDKDEKDEPKEPTQEEMIKLGPSGYKPNTYVEILGLTSDDGKRLNGQKGRVTRYIYEKMRYEVSVGSKMVSVRPVNLQETERPDANWTYGNTCRLVYLQDAEEEELRDANGSLGFLASLVCTKQLGTWKVIANGKTHAVYPENLRVCKYQEETASLTRVSQVVQWFTIVGTLHLLLGFAAVVMKLDMPEAFAMDLADEEFDEAAGALNQMLNAKVPSVSVANLNGLIVVWTFLLFWGTVFSCCWMHRCLWDPAAFFPQIAELSLGRNAAGMVFQRGIAMVSAMVFATVVLYKKLVQPHLPYMGTAGDDIFFWGVAAAVGIAVLAAFQPDVTYTWRTLLHRLAGGLVSLAAVKHTGWTRTLYLPGVPTAASVWFQGLLDYLPDRHILDGTEDEAANQEAMIKRAQELVASSNFLRHPYVQIAIMIRYHILSCWPIIVVILPVLSGTMKREPDSTKVSASSSLRSMFARLQWLVSFICSVMFLSYAADLYVASLLPIPTVDTQEPVEAD